MGQPSRVALCWPARASISKIIRRLPLSPTRPVAYGDWQSGWFLTLDAVSAYAGYRRPRAPGGRARMEESARCVATICSPESGLTRGEFLQFLCAWVVGLATGFWAGHESRKGAKIRDPLNLRNKATQLLDNKGLNYFGPMQFGPFFGCFQAKKAKKSQKRAVLGRKLALLSQLLRVTA